MGIEQLVEMYKGNPAPLDAKVKQAQQAQPQGGIPPDLEEAMALQKIADLRQGAQNQQAMQAGGAQMSVVEKLRQILSAQQRQQAQPVMAQGQPQMGQAAPPQQAQPVMAARGGSIAHLMSNLGKHYAGGGIVAFTPGGDVEDSEKLKEEEAREILRRIRQRTDMRPESMAVTDTDTTSIPGFVAGNRFQQEMDRATGKREPMTPQQMETRVKAAEPERAPSPPREPYSGPQQVTQRELAEAYVRKRQQQREEDANKPEDEMLKLVKQPFQAAGRGLAGLFKSLYGQKIPGEAPEQVGIDQNLGESIMQASRNREAAEDNRPVAIGTEAQRRLPSISGQGLPAAAAAMASGQGAPSGGRASGRVSGVDNAPLPGGLTDLTKLPSVGVGRDYIQRMLAENQKFDPEAYKQKFLKEVGTKDTSIYDEMAAELKARKDRLKNPEPGFESFMEYLSQIAESGGGRDWTESGTKGAAKLRALKKERQTQQDELVDKILDIGAKKKEAQYNEKLGLFNLTKTEKDRVGTESRELAKSLNLSEDKAIELQQQMTIEMMKIKTQKEISGMPGSDERFFNRFAADWMAKPENKGKSISDAYAAYKLAGSPSAGGKPMTRDQASDNVMKKIAYDSPIRNDLMNEARDALKKAGIASPSATQITDYLIDKELGRFSAAATAPSSGKVVDFNALPK